ncbi:unnamed protein product [Blepharisma stoltei]|uniref:Uncharacterized protein n=1 Tax=Blepharisma stoltei TaxID=1481888 RepID=A0AAU9IU57_9CILI|nr:unnamed protein product [Blepharisma stoltei]
MDQQYSSCNNVSSNSMESGKASIISFGKIESRAESLDGEEIYPRNGLRDEKSGSMITLLNSTKDPEIINKGRQIESTMCTSLWVQNEKNRNSRNPIHSNNCCCLLLWHNFKFLN